MMWQYQEQTPERTAQIPAYETKAVMASVNFIDLAGKIQAPLEIKLYDGTSEDVREKYKDTTFSEILDEIARSNLNASSAAGQYLQELAKNIERRKQKNQRLPEILVARIWPHIMKKRTELGSEYYEFSATIRQRRLSLKNKTLEEKC